MAFDEPWERNRLDIRDMRQSQVSYSQCHFLDIRLQNVPETRVKLFGPKGAGEKDAMEVGVQQELMRHADIRTTMNIYGDAVTEDMRQAHRKVAGLALGRSVN